MHARERGTLRFVSPRAFATSTRRDPRMSTHQQRPRTPNEHPAAVPAPNQDSQLEQGNLVVVQERVLAEIAHELGNFFHKLYYWSDYIKGDAEGAKKFDT